MKYKENDHVTLNDQREARVITAKGGDDKSGNEPRYYVAYVEGGGRGWWPESLIQGKVDEVKLKTGEAAKAPAPANAKSFGES